MKANYVPAQCPKCKTGLMFNVTSRLALALGVQNYKCDKCGHTASSKQVTP